MLRFWSKVDRQNGPSGCWFWLASKSTRGYGHYYPTGNNTKMAHKYAYEEFFGKVPLGLELDHLCRNTSCVNPAHLEAVTHLENVRRGNQGKIQSLKEFCPRGHSYTKFGRRDKRGSRYCKECHKERWHER